MSCDFNKTLSHARFNSSTRYNVEWEISQIKCFFNVIWTYMVMIINLNRPVVKLSWTKINIQYTVKVK